MITQERYTPNVVGVNATLSIQSQGVAGFICVTAGTVSIVNSKGVTIVNAFPVTAGNIYGFSLFLGNEGGSFTTAGGASGTVATL